MEACGDEWKEWTSLKGLVEQIPKQYQFGLSVASLNLTCLDAYHDHLVIGTNAGLVYLGHLPSFNLIRLKCENVSSPIQCVASVSSVDDMIAAGSCNGIITVFQIPSASSADKLTSSQGDNVCNSPITQPSSLQRFTLRVHKAPVTALVWSRNGMRLFSGDREGHVCLVEVDYERQQCIGKSLFKVDTRVVQLSYAHQMLAISYEERCLIYNLKDNCTNVVGKKPRNPPGLFGCAFAPGSELPKEDILYCARPGQRIWSTNTMGEVLFSYIQKKSLQGSTIQLLEIPKLTQQKAKFSFGYLYHYKGSILVSYSGNGMIVLNVSVQKVLAYCDDFAQICDVAVAGDNIFVLDSNRSIICISPYKPSFGREPCIRSMNSSLHVLSQENLTPATLSKIKSKMILPNKHLIDGIAKLGGTVASKLSEIAAPTIVPGDKHVVDEGSGSSEGLQIIDYQAQIHRPKPYFLGMSGGVAFQSKVAPDEKISERNPTPELLEAGRLTPQNDEIDQRKESTAADKDRKYDVIVLPSRSKIKAKKKIELSDSNQEMKRETEIRKFNDDSRTYEDFKETIEENESLLADVLNLSALKMDHENKTAEEIDNKDNDQDYPQMTSSKKELQNHFVSLSEPAYDEVKSLEYPHLRKLTYGPPSGSSVATSSLEDLSLGQPATNPRYAANAFKKVVSVSAISIEGSTFQEVNTMPPAEELPWGWQKHHLPARPRGFLGYENTILFLETRDLYFSSDFSPENQILPSWTRKKLMVEIASFCSFDKDLHLLTKQGHLLLLDRDKLISPDPLCGRFVLEDREVVSAASDQNVVWILSRNGKVVARLTSESSEKEIKISCQELRLKSLVCRAGVVWGLTTSGRIAYRIGVRPTVPVGIEWGIMLHSHKVMCIHLSENGLGWMMDSEGGLYVSLYVSQSYPQGLDGKWWQIGMSDYMLEETSQRTSGTSAEVPNVQMTSNEHYLWVSQTDYPFAFSHSLRSFVGHHWEVLGPSRFQAISGGGIFKLFGTLYCLNKTGDLFAVNPYEDCVLPIESPNREKLASVSARPESLWALTKSGKIFIRTGLSGSSCLGSKWGRLDLQQIADVRLKHLSLSTEVVWAVDTKGQVYMRQGPVTSPNPRLKGLDPAWLHVDSNELKNGAVFEEVHVGNKSHMVWGLDSSGRIYVREAIFPELFTGTSWVLVPGIYAQSLSISENKVYVVTPSRGDSDGNHLSSGNSFGGQLFEREGVSSTNYIGDSWKRIPSNSIPLQSITVSVDDCLWGLDREGRILKHTSLSLFDVSLHGKIPEGEEEPKKIECSSSSNYLF